MEHSKHIASWFVYNEGWTAKDAWNKVKPVADILNSLSICGNEVPLDFIRKCQNNGITTYRLVSGNASDFNTENNRTSTIEQYLEICHQQGYDGIDLDYEHLDCKYQNDYTIFMQSLKKELKKTQKKMSICVGYYPEIQKDPTRYFYHPEIIKETCDMVQVMCYVLCPLHGQIH